MTLGNSPFFATLFGGKNLVPLIWKYLLFKSYIFSTELKNTLRQHVDKERCHTGYLW